MNVSRDHTLFWRIDTLLHVVFGSIAAYLGFHGSGPVPLDLCFVGASLAGVHAVTFVTEWVARTNAKMRSVCQADIWTFGFYRRFAGLSYALLLLYSVVVIRPATGSSFTPTFFYCVFLLLWESVLCILGSFMSHGGPLIDVKTDNVQDTKDKKA